VVYMGTLNFGGFKLNLISVDETYVDEKNAEQKYFPADAAMVTAPGCGHMMYGQITQIDYGNTDYTTYVASRVSKFVLDQDKDIRKLRLGTRPIAAPKNYCPYIYAAQVIG
ncbi:MAG: major capsid protein, partial [Clostridia bacterium]|nr:major capsid protein [Clostridia bacterium]